MNFEYNGNLEERERVLQVAQEIINYYPEVTFEKAKLIASLEEPITKDVDGIMYFKRLYNILFIVQQDKNLSAKIYNEIIKVYKKGLKMLSKVASYEYTLRDKCYKSVFINEMIIKVLIHELKHAGHIKHLFESKNYDLEFEILRERRL